MECLKWWLNANEAQQLAGGYMKTDTQNQPTPCPVWLWQNDSVCWGTVGGTKGQQVSVHTAQSRWESTDTDVPTVNEFLPARIDASVRAAGQLTGSVNSEEFIGGRVLVKPQTGSTRAHWLLCLGFYILKAAIVPGSFIEQVLKKFYW